MKHQGKLRCPGNPKETGKDECLNGKELERTHNRRSEWDEKECAVLKKKYVEVWEMNKGVIEILF